MNGASPADLGIGAAVWMWQAGRPVRAAAGAVVRGTAGQVLRLAPDELVAALAERGRAGRAELERLAATLLRDAIRLVVAALLDTVDLTALVRRHVDLNAVAAALDVDAVAARLDLDAVLARLDLDAVVRRLDLDAVVRRVDLDAVVGRVDVDAVARRVDPGPLVARVDVDAVIARVDLVGIAREVIAAIDLPEIVRTSTGGLTSDTVRSVRAEAVQADDLVAGVVDRLLRRTGSHPADPP
ncbi:hypothetical protein BJF78_07845 [Pseudonocardia sp. CNS-139]|nr:hypothetical protein BJF78_07845 [Pseudonocardia sp. CNS-139]